MNKQKLSLRWEERGEPFVHGAPEREGFGSMLARRSINGQLNGEFAFDWRSEGLTVRFTEATEHLAK